MTVVAEDSNVRIEKLDTTGIIVSNVYLVVCQHTGDSALIDAPGAAGKLMEQIKGTNLKYILITHSHGDHIGALAELRAKLAVQVAAHALEADKLPVSVDIILNDGDTILFGALKLKVMHTPGHTSGGVCFLTDKYLLSGDTIFPGGPGKTGSPAALKQIINSITEKILVLPDDTQVYSGHGDSTVLKKEREEFAVFSSRPHDSNLCGDVLWLSS